MKKRQVIIIVVYLVLLLCAVPWYWPAESSGQFLGLPYWVLSSLFFALLSSFFTCWLLLFPKHDEQTRLDEDAR